MVSHVAPLPSPATGWGPKGPVCKEELSPTPAQERTQDTVPRARQAHEQAPPLQNIPLFPFGWKWG